MIKLIVSDIDGTLVSDGSHEIDPELLEVISALRERGVQFAAASGRHWDSIERLFDPIKKKIFYLSDNGSYIGCFGRSLFTELLRKEDLTELILDVRKRPDLDLVLTDEDRSYTESNNQEFLDWLINGYRFGIRQVEDLLTVEGVIKAAIYKKDQIREATVAFTEKYKDRFHMAQAGEMWLDFMAPGVCKGTAVQTIQEALGIRPEETMAFGDQMNDVEMLGRAYYSFAVANARPEVKKAARFMTDSNNQGGVLKILKMLL